MAFDSRLCVYNHCTLTVGHFSSIIQAEKEVDDAFMCLSDFVAPKNNGVLDYVGMFAVTCGLGSKELCSK